MPESRRIVVVNATPLIALTLIDRLDLLQALYGQVTIPGAVQGEVLAGGREGRAAVDVSRLPWVRVVRLQDATLADLLVDLDRGEAEVLALALEMRADLVILDERLARRHAQRLGLLLTGTLGVLLGAKQRGLISQVAPLLDQLRQSGIWLNEAVVSEALRLAEE
jgi:predicted nucleic acid-binding protein